MALDDLVDRARGSRRRCRRCPGGWRLGVPSRSSSRNCSARLVVANVPGGDDRALRGQAAADRGADAAGAAGDERDPALELVARSARRAGSLGVAMCSPLPFLRLVALSGPSARPSHSARSGQISLRAFEPAIRPMCPPGRSRCVTSSLETRSSSGSVPRARGDVVGARGDDEQVLVDRPQVDALAAQPHAAAHEPVLLVHPGDPLAVGARRERRVVGDPLGHRLVGLAAWPSPS